MTAQVDPDWSKLPYSPVEFFELPAGYDRKQLKRKYNALIKIFKPEKSPAEFQKIRAAFEVLDGELRYGTRPVIAGPGSNYQWAVDAIQAKPPAADPGGSSPQSVDTPRTPALSVKQRLATESPTDIYNELSQKSDKRPVDFYSLAILSDIVSNDPTLFVKWLLTGLKTHRRDPGLMGILLSYYQQDLPKELLSSLLLTTSQVIQDDLFYFATEKLWSQLLVKQGFDVFKSTLEKCESRLRDFRVAGKLAFYVYILRSAVWTAPTTWSDQAFKFLDEHYLEIPKSLEFDVEVLHAIREFCQLRQSQKSENKVRKRIVKAIIDYFSLSEKEGDQSVVRCQTHLAADPNVLLDAFPLGDEIGEKLYFIWEFVNIEVCQRNGLDHPTDQKALGQSVYNLCLDLDASHQQGLWTLAEYYLITKGSYVLWFLLPFIFFGWLSNIPGIGLVLCVVGAGLAVGSHLFLKPEELFANNMRRRTKKLYLKNWRSRFLQVLDATQAYPTELSQSMEKVFRLKQDLLGISQWLVELVPQDVGLMYYAITTRFAR